MTRPDPRPESRRPLVANVSRYLPQYRVAFYEAVRSALASEGIDFLYVHGQPGPAEAAKGDAATLGWETVTTNTVVPVGRGGLWWQHCLSHVWHADLVIVEQASRLLVNYVLDAGRAAGGPRLAFWGHGAHVHADEAGRARARLKRRLATRADWWFAYTDQSADAIAAAGYPRRRITVIENTLDTEGLARTRDAVRSDDLEATRRDMGIGPGPVIAFSGALYPQKRIDVLIDAVDTLRTALPDVQLLVIGDGEQSAWVRAAGSSRPWLHVAGALFGSDKVRCLALADVLALPAAVGLAVLDSFALEIPLVTIAGLGQGHELSYVRSGVNGVVVGERAGPDEYAAALGAVLTDDHLRARLREGCREAAQRYTIANMVKRFTAGVRLAVDTLGLPRPARP